MSGGTLNHGKDLLYTINGGDQLTSRSNTITEASSSIAGLSVSALRVGLTSVEVTSDSAKIKTAIADFLADYNKVQSFIDAQTSSTTDASGKVTAGVLAAESDANEVAVRLRGFVNATGRVGTGVYSDRIGRSKPCVHVPGIEITHYGRVSSRQNIAFAAPNLMIGYARYFRTTGVSRWARTGYKLVFTIDAPVQLVFSGAQYLWRRLTGASAKHVGKSREAAHGTWRFLTRELRRFWRA